MRSATGLLLGQMERTSSGAASAVSRLEQLDIVKRRMEDACSTLKVCGPSPLTRGHAHPPIHPSTHSPSYPSNPRACAGGGWPLLPVLPSE